MPPVGGSVVGESVAGGSVLVVAHEVDAGLDLMAGPLGGPAAVTVVRPYLGEAVPSPDDLTSGTFAGLLVLGGEMAAWEDERAPWLPATRALLAAAVRAELPTLGVCLGAQLLAHSTGGRAERGGAGTEIGLVEVTPTPAAAGDRFTAVAPRFTSLSYHGDAVTKLPDDGEVLATGAVYPVQAFRVGSSAWGVQYHPEVSPTAFAGWVNSSTLPDDERARLLAVAAAAAGSQRELATAHALSFRKVLGQEEQA